MSATGNGGFQLSRHRLGLSELRELRDRPHRVLLDIARAGGDVITLRVGPARAYLLVHPDAVKHVFVDRWRNYDRSTFQYRLLRGVAGDGLLSMDGPDWLPRRRAAAPAFSHARIRGYAEIMESAAYRVLRRWEVASERGAEVDVVQDMSRFALEVLSATLLGAVADGDTARDELVHATEIVLDHVMFRSRGLSLVPEWLPTERNRRYRDARTRLDTMATEAIREARAGGEAGHLLDLLLGIDDPVLTDAQLRDELVTFLIAGHETVASALAWTWYMLAVNPEVDARMYDFVRQGIDPLARSRGAEYVGSVFQETLRLFPPAWVTTRRAIAADEICGQTVPAGSLVVASPYATQRLPALWAEPDRFEPDRFTSGARHHRFAHFPFGGGPHLCVGNHFALLEGVVLLTALSARFRMQAPPAPVDAEAGVTLRPTGLRMRPVRRAGEARGGAFELLGASQGQPTAPTTPPRVESS